MLQGAQQYRTLFEGMEDILLVHDAAGCVLGCNAAACERLGLARNELVGRRLQELESPEHARTFIGRLEEQYARGRHAYESALVTTGGETIPVHVRAGRIDFGGQDAFMLVARDISEQKRAEQALAWELDLHAALADVSRVLLAHEVVSIDDVSVRVLQHARQLTGSAFGYVGYIDTENGDLVCPTMTRDIWKECNVPGKSVRFTKFSGLWGWVLEQREALLTNDPASDPRSTGTPAGHLPIKRFLAAPALVGEQLVGQLALANAERDYTDRDLEAVRRLAETYALAVERMRGAERVRAGEARYRALFESNADAVFVMDHRFVDCNDKACEMWRARKEDIIGREPGDLSPTVQPDGRLSADVARAHVDAAMRGERQYFSWQHRRLDGTLMDAEVSLSAVRVHEAPLVLATVRDVTERVRQERREGHLTAVLRAIRNVNQLICTERDRGRLMQGVCDCLVETRGYTSAWIMSLDEHGRPGPAAHATAAGMSERLELALARGGELACVARALDQAESVVVLDPAEACADCVGLPPHEGQGVLTTRLEHAGTTYGVLTVGMPADLVADEEEQALFAEVAGDVALALHGLKQDEARRAVERSLRESEEKYRSLFDSSRDGIAIVALDGRIEDANPAFLDIVGYSLEEVRALRYQEFTPAEYAEYEQQIVSQQIVGRGYADEYEKEYIRKDGSRVPVRIRAWLVRDERGEPLRMWGQIRDIRAERTAAEERAQLESQLRQSQKLEAVGQLAGGVAHDLNNVLTAVLGNVELMRLALEDVLSEKDPMLGHLDLIEQAAERAAALTRQLLAFSRRDVIRPEVLNLNAVVQGMEKMLRRLISENIDLVYRLEPEPTSVMADAGQMEQIIINLAVNARDAMPDGGTIWIETSHAQVDDGEAAMRPHAEAGAYVKLAVRDNGSGIPPQVRERIFEPFFTTKPVGRGTGLGLATVYGIVRQNGGHIRVQSEVGEGATFEVYLPAVPMEAEPQPADETEAAETRGRETILVCEDDETVRDVAARYLRSAGYDVLAAGNGEEALRLARDRQVDLLITDVIMPDMNGRQLATRLEGMRAGLPTMFMSGYTSNVIAHHGVLDDDVMLLEKPFSRQALLTRVRQMLDAVGGDGGGTR